MKKNILFVLMLATTTFSWADDASYSEDDSNDSSSSSFDSSSWEFDASCWELDTSNDSSSSSSQDGFDTINGILNTLVKDLNNTLQSELLSESPCFAREQLHTLMNRCSQLHQKSHETFDTEDFPHELFEQGSVFIALQNELAQALDSIRDQDSEEEI